MSLHFKLLPNLLSDMRLEGELCSFTFKSKIFSLSAVLTDDNNQPIATLKRTSWWRYRFDLDTSEGRQYKCYKKWGEFFIEAVNSDVLFHTQSTLDLYLKGSIRATVLQTAGQLNDYHTLEINESDHWQALLMMSCVMFELYGRQPHC